MAYVYIIRKDILKTNGDLNYTANAGCFGSLKKALERIELTLQVYGGKYIRQEKELTAGEYEEENHKSILRIQRWHIE